MFGQTLGRNEVHPPEITALSLVDTIDPLNRLFYGDGLDCTQSYTYDKGSLYHAISFKLF